MRIGIVGYGAGGSGLPGTARLWEPCRTARRRRGRGDHHHAAARELVEAATRAGVVLNVYHNRRRDADILTLADVLASGELGETWRVHSTMDWTDRFGERTGCGFVVTMTHASGAVSTVSASKLNHSTTRELRAYGSLGSYIASGADVQADALAAGRRP